MIMIIISLIPTTYLPHCVSQAKTMATGQWWEYDDVDYDEEDDDDDDYDDDDDDDVENL